MLEHASKFRLIYAALGLSALGAGAHIASPAAHRTPLATVGLSYVPHRHRACVIGSGWVYHMSRAFGEALANSVKLTHIRNPNLGEPTLVVIRKTASTMLENESITLSDGRTLSFAIYGSPVPRTTVMYMHGFPSSRFEGKLWHSAAAKHGVRLLAPDRPGSGFSTFQKNRRILDWPADITALANELKIKEFYVLGASGGGPYALACVKSIPRERLLGVTVASGLYPLKFGAEGMMLPTRILFWAAPLMTGLTSFFFNNSMGKAARDKDPRVLEDLMKNEPFKRHPGDVQAIHDPLNWPIFVAMTRGSFAKSGEGAAWEARLFGSDWRFELDQLLVGEDAVPLTLWHGTSDMNVPVGMATTAKAAMIGSVLNLKKGDGHMDYVFRDAEEILLDLIGKQEAEEYVKVSGFEANSLHWGASAHS
jgi:pimeloyl-ACP methyl ester carboxylesterase